MTIESVRPDPARRDDEPSGRLYRRFRATSAAANLAIVAGDAAPVTEEEIGTLPPCVQRYMRFMGVVGRPRDWSVRAHLTGRFRRQPGERWMPCEAWQYSTARPIARIFHMRVWFARVAPMVARDTYVDGRGRMVGKLLDLITVVDASGDEVDISELVTFLDDAILLAPSMLLGANTTWEELDDRAFQVTLTDAGRVVSGRVTLDERGAPTEFMTADRFAALKTGTIRAEWRTPVESWTITNGRPVPGPSSAIWALPDGPFSYVEVDFLPDGLAYNVLPPMRPRHGDSTDLPTESSGQMTKQQTFAEHVGHLEARLGVFNDHLRASAHETSAQLHTRAVQLRECIKTGTDELSAEMKETTKWLAQRATGLRAAVTADIEAARSKYDATKQSEQTIRDAEVAEAYAAAAHSEAVAAIAESEQAAIEALAARAVADDLTSAATH